jgi:hypothetical protein
MNSWTFLFGLAPRSDALYRAILERSRRIRLFAPALRSDALTRGVLCIPHAKFKGY